MEALYTTDCRLMSHVSCNVLLSCSLLCSAVTTYLYDNSHNLWACDCASISFFFSFLSSYFQTTAIIPSSGPKKAKEEKRHRRTISFPLVLSLFLNKNANKLQKDFLINSFKLLAVAQASSKANSFFPLVFLKFSSIRIRWEKRTASLRHQHHF